MKRRYTAIVIILFFLYGVHVGQDKVFPYPQIKKVTESFKSDKQNPNPVNHHDIGEKHINNSHYKSRVSFFRENTRNNYDLVFVGDSITERSIWSDIFPNVAIANRGINGDITSGVINRMDTIVNTHARKAFIMIGTNDIAWNIDNDIIFENYKKIINQIQNSGLEVIVQSVLFTDGNKKQKNKVIKDLNDKIKSYCDSNNIDFVDLNKELSDGNVLNKQYSYDGLHLNGEAYKVWGNVIKPYLL